LAIVLSASSIRVSWTAITDATGYKVYRSTAYNGEYSVISGASPVSGISYDNIGLSTSTTYYYKVSAIYAGASESALSSSYSSASTPAAAPTNVAATTTGRMITLTWTPAEGAGTHYVYCSLTGTPGTFAYVSSTSGAAAYIVTTIGYGGVPLAASTTYYFKVGTRLNALESEMSATANVTTGP
jgi:fibronectin type 3 domain-containing protein